MVDPIVDEQLIDGTVHDVLRRIDEKLVSHNRTAVDFTSGPSSSGRSRIRSWRFSSWCATRCCTARYEVTNAPVRVYWYDDRIEITNPGGAFGVVTPENFGEPGVTDYRNPNLAEALRVLGFVQHFGAGIPIARRALESNGNPPLEFDVQPTFVGVTVRTAS